MLDLSLLIGIKEQAEKYYNCTWDELVSEDNYSEDVWKNIENTDKFILNDQLIIPYCLLWDGGTIIATINLRIIKHIEYQQAEVKIYEKTDKFKPSYFLYSGDDNNILPKLFEWKV